jgi:hypothetical protein
MSHIIDVLFYGKLESYIPENRPLYAKHSYFGLRVLIIISKTYTIAL